MSLDSTLRIVSFRSDLAPAFARLNLAWIERFFELEEADQKIFANPEAAIVIPGGQIFFALVGEEVIGTCAVIRHDTATFELAKMAVTPTSQGLGVGRRLGETAVRFARTRGADRLTLLTNSRLASAIRLYERLGFVYRPLPPDTSYARADVFMELRLHPVAS